MNKEQIAKTCHAVHRAYCNEMNMKTQPEWDEISKEHKEVIMNSVDKIISGKITSASESHYNFVNQKVKDGWKYDKEYSIEEKKNPRLTLFSELLPEQRMKEILFFTTVKSFM